MRSGDEIWIEIVEARLEAGESAVAAISKANLVVNDYCRRFGGGIESWEKPLNLEQHVGNSYEERSDKSIPSSGYAAGGEFAGQS